MSDPTDLSPNIEGAQILPLWKRAIRVGLPIGMAAIALAELGQVDPIAAVDGVALAIAADSMASSSFPSYGNQRSRTAAALWVGVAAAAAPMCAHLAAGGHVFHALGAAIAAAYGVVSAWHHAGPREETAEATSQEEVEIQMVPALVTTAASPRRRRPR